MNRRTAIATTALTAVAALGVGLLLFADDAPAANQDGPAALPAEEGPTERPPLQEPDLTPDAGDARRIGLVAVDERTGQPVAGAQFSLDRLDPTGPTAVELRSHDGIRPLAVVLPAADATYVARVVPPPGWTAVDDSDGGFATPSCGSSDLFACVTVTVHGGRLAVPGGTAWRGPDVQFVLRREPVPSEDAEIGDVDPARRGTIGVIAVDETPGQRGPLEDAVIDVHSATGELLGRVRTGSQGLAKILAPPATYSLTFRPPVGYETIGMVVEVVTVPADLQNRHVTFRARMIVQEPERDQMAEPPVEHGFVPSPTPEPVEREQADPAEDVDPAPAPVEPAPVEPTPVEQPGTGFQAQPEQAPVAPPAEVDPALEAEVLETSGR